MTRFSGKLLILDMMRLAGLVMASTQCCIFLQLLQITPHAGIQFKTPYEGKYVRGLVGSSMNFTWSFSGDIRTVQWGLKRSDIEDINSSAILAGLDQSGPQPVTVPSAYAGRVIGNGDISSGRAIFTLMFITPRDERIYGCKLTDTDALFPAAKFDFVVLVVEEEPAITYLTNVDSSYKEGSVVNISCEASGKPIPDVRWILNGTMKSCGSKTAHLTLRKVGKADAGLYICRANNSVGSAEGRLNLVVNCELCNSSKLCYV